MLRRRHEDASRVLQQLLRADAEHDVFALAVVYLRHEDFEIPLVRRAVERIAIGLGKLAEDRVDGRLARAKRVLVAADTNRFDSRRELWSHAAGALASALLHEFRHVCFVAARRHEFGGVRGTTQSQTLKETAARHRHEIPPSATVPRDSG